MKTQQTDEPSLTTRLTGTYPKPAKRKPAVPAQAQHSPLPWTFDGYRIMAGPFDVGSKMDWTATYVQVATVTLNTEHTPKPIMEANAAFIVRACNNAQRLADALADLRSRVVAEKVDCLNTTKADEALAEWSKSI